MITISNKYLPDNGKVKIMTPFSGAKTIGDLRDALRSYRSSKEINPICITEIRSFGGFDIIIKEIKKD